MNGDPDYIKAIAEVLGVSWMDLLSPEALQTFNDMVTTPENNMGQGDISSGQNVRLEAKINMSGTWNLTDIYHGGHSSGIAILTQDGVELSGSITLRETPDNSAGFVIEEKVSGVIRGGTVTLSGISYQVVEGQLDQYWLDRWVGTIKDTNTVEGHSTDLYGLSGEFIMRRAMS
jgi:hypothetical protein